MPVTKSSKQMVDEALAQIETLTVEQAKKQVEEGTAMMLDVRDPRELKRDGEIPGAFHCPRGLIEFWIDPESMYFRKELATPKKLVLFCAMGWRSALTTKTLKEMGLDNVAHIRGGFNAWKDAGNAVTIPEPKPAK